MIKTYVFDADLGVMRNRLQEWHKDLINNGLTVEQSRMTLKALYLKCDEAFGWPLSFYNQMVDSAINS